jgi:hypothetical protein
MNPEIVLQGPSAGRYDVSRIDLSAEAILKREIAKLSQWLTAARPSNEHAHADEGSRDRLYLR